TNAELYFRSRALSILPYIPDTQLIPKRTASAAAIIINPFIKADSTYFRSGILSNIFFIIFSFPLLHRNRSKEILNFLPGYSIRLGNCIDVFVIIKNIFQLHHSAAELIVILVCLEG